MIKTDDANFIILVNIWYSIAILLYTNIASFITTFVTFILKVVFYITIARMADLAIAVYLLFMEVFIWLQCFLEISSFLSDLFWVFWFALRYLYTLLWTYIFIVCYLIVFFKPIICYILKYLLIHKTFDFIERFTQKKIK